MTTLEDRLRAHSADRTSREPLPGPPTDDALEALQWGEARLVALPDPSDPRPRGRWARHHRGLLAAAAACWWPSSSSARSPSPATSGRGWRPTRIAPPGPRRRPSR